MLNFEVLRLSVYEFIYFIYPPEAVVTKGINKFFAEKECNLEEIQSTGKKLNTDTTGKGRVRLISGIEDQVVHKTRK